MINFNDSDEVPYALPAVNVTDPDDPTLEEIVVVLSGWIDRLIRERVDLRQKLAALRAERDDYYEWWNDCQGKRMAAEAEVEKLRGALEAAEAWIVDGGYLDDKDPYVAESAACVYGQTRAALTTEADNGLV